jgi:hypothetical protein
MTTEDAQLFVAQWAFAASALERARQQEVAAFSHEEQASKIDELPDCFTPALDSRAG